MRWWILTVCCFLSLSLQAVNDFERQQTLRRIKPIGKVRVQTDDAKAMPAEEESEEAPEEKERGQETYEQYCATCHRGGLAGAPKFREASDWTSRLSQKDVAALTASVVNGLGAMPPKGTCMECDETELRDAVEYMLPNHE